MEHERQYEYPVQYEVGEALDLTKLSEEDLRGIIDEAGHILKEMKKDREARAAAEIRALAKKHGLNVTIDRRKRPRAKSKRQTA